MRILLNTQLIPFPPDAGPRVKTWNMLRYLAQQGHEVHLASYMRAEEEPDTGAVRDICVSVSTVPIQRSLSADLVAWLRSHGHGRPFLVERDDLQAMRGLVRRIVVDKEIEVVHADQLSMAQFGLQARRALKGTIARPWLIFDAHNAVWRVLERFKDKSSALMRPVLDLEARRIKRYEGQIVRAFDRTLAVSEIDRSALIEASISGANGRGMDNGDHPIGLRISVIPIGVDTEQLQPAPRPSNSHSVLTLGTLHYPPNADGIRWFSSEVFPLVQAQAPEATLTIVGKNPPSDIQSLAANSDGAINVTGYSPDLTPYLEAAAVMVVPVRAGGGMRVRILEGFARGMPMVTTTLGLEGIEAAPNQDILVADTPTQFALQVVRLLENEQLRESLSRSGRRLAERKYDWKRALTPLGELYSRSVMETYAAV